MHYCLQPALAFCSTAGQSLCCSAQLSSVAMSLCYISILDYLVFVVSSRITVHVHAL
jgi:hypothetical protein